MEDLQKRTNRETVRDYKRFIEDESVDLDLNDLFVDITGTDADAGATLPNPVLTKGQIFYIKGHDNDGSNERVITVTIPDADGNTSSQTISGNSGATADGHLLLYSAGEEYLELSSSEFA